MDENINALDEINKGACMGMDAISIIKEKVEDKKLKKEIEHEYKEYKKITDEIKKIYEKYNNGEPHETNMMNKVMTWSGVEMRTISDSSTSKLAELLITGVNMGIIEGTKILNNKEISEDVTLIVKTFITMQENNLDNLKKYL